ncbi:hypothetical protein ACFQMA_02495 [Halosimplex aquaticum]|uniref:HEAT repeat domain-containing protein n=1 Tax=Halosimplex aquaticum TaxID=3026162 RepID=A0ABD5XUB0_9EURY|nr:hypothetical protein [Halosimplex aquaticum]
MSTPEENLEIALDDARESESREQAIDGLQTANECDMLAEIVRADGVESRYRELAMTKLGHPQCKATLETLHESGEIPDSLRDQAEELLGNTPDDSGAGP